MPRRRVACAPHVVVAVVREPFCFRALHFASSSHHVASHAWLARGLAPGQASLKVNSRSVMLQYTAASRRQSHQAVRFACAMFPRPGHRATTRCCSGVFFRACASVHTASLHATPLQHSASWFWKRPCCHIYLLRLMRAAESVAAVP